MNILSIQLEQFIMPIELPINKGGLAVKDVVVDTSWH